MLEPHPNLPYLATSGLDDDVKVWIPAATSEAADDPMKSSEKAVAEWNLIEKVRKKIDELLSKTNEREHFCNVKEKAFKPPAIFI